MTTKAPSWANERLDEHCHTLATLQMLRDGPPLVRRGIRGDLLEGEIHRCSTDLFKRMNDQGIRSFTTSTHKATALANGTVRVERKSE